MAPKIGPQNCPQCGASNASARILAGRSFCSGCGQELVACRMCGATNLSWSSFCHNCGKPAGRELKEVPSKTVGTVPSSSVTEEFSIEKMRLCASCKKTIGEGERFCSYCGAKQIVLHAESEAALDPHTMKVALDMLTKIMEAKDHPEYSSIDQLTTLIGDVALNKEEPRDAHELSFSNQLRLLTLVFEYARDKVGYKGETFGEHIRWPWETVKTGGDCDCKVVLLATMLASLAFRRMYLLVLPPGSYLDTRQRRERMVQGHVMLEVELSERNRMTRVRLDPSCTDCDVDEIPESVQPFLQNFYRIPITRPSLGSF